MTVTVAVPVSLNSPSVTEKPKVSSRACPSPPALESIRLAKAVLAVYLTVPLLRTNGTEVIALSKQ